MLTGSGGGGCGCRQTSQTVSSFSLVSPLSRGSLAPPLVTKCNSVGPLRKDGGRVQQRGRRRTAISETEAPDETLVASVVELFASELFSFLFLMQKMSVIASFSHRRVVCSLLGSALTRAPPPLQRVAGGWRRAPSAWTPRLGRGRAGQMNVLKPLLRKS